MISDRGKYSRILILIRYFDKIQHMAPKDDVIPVVLIISAIVLFVTENLFHYPIAIMSLLGCIQMAKQKFLIKVLNIFVGYFLPFGCRWFWHVSAHQTLFIVAKQRSLTYIFCLWGTISASRVHGMGAFNSW